LRPHFGFDLAPNARMKEKAHPGARQVRRERSVRLDEIGYAPRADGQLPDSPVVHPEVCGYPCPELCGTAVAFKLAAALGAPTVEDDIELVAHLDAEDQIGVIARALEPYRAAIEERADAKRNDLRERQTFQLCAHD